MQSYYLSLYEAPSTNNSVFTTTLSKGVDEEEIVEKWKYEKRKEMTL